MSALLGTAGALAQGPSAQGQSAQGQSAQGGDGEARARFTQGRQLYEVGNYDGALVEFQAVFGLMTGHPRRFVVLYNIGRAHEMLFHYDQALDFYRRYLEAGGLGQPNGEEVRHAIRVLQGLLASVDLQVGSSQVAHPVGEFEVWVDGHHVTDSRTTVSVTGGTHVFEIRAEGFAPGRQEIQIPARTTQTLVFRLEAGAEGFSGVHPAFFFGSAGAAVVSVAVGAVFGGLALSRRGEVDQLLMGDSPSAGLGVVTQSDRDEIAQLSLVADLLYGGGILLGATALVLAFLTDFGGEDSASTANNIWVRPVLGLASMPAGTPAAVGSLELELGGSF